MELQYIANMRKILSLLHTVQGSIYLILKTPISIRNKALKKHISIN